MPKGSMTVASPASAATPSEMEMHSSPGGQDAYTGSQMAAMSEDEESRAAGTPGGGGGGGSATGRKIKFTREQNMAQNSAIMGKIRHLKKEDGEPLWRKDIQYDFLKAVFDNDEPVFTNRYEKDRLGPQTFADLYIDTMSRSSKTSKVLRDKLLTDREAAKSMAMVCLLVNIGRMNTTLNCE